MASGPTTLVISYGTSSQATLPIPAALIGTNNTDWYTAIKNLYLGGGFVVPNTQIFIPWGEITQVQAV